MVEVDSKPLAEAPNPSPDSASLVKRLAGPSVTKAGLAKDQSEINRIIAEVSKGSKFYENEKRKDKELTERISKILKIKDDVVKEADILRVEAEADRLLIEFEAGRDLSQSIVHVDMDAFYANVELLFNPELEGKPFGVGKGVLCTASYEARKYGVRSGMAGFVAKKLCPELILLPLNFERYSEMSSRVMSILKQYDPNMVAAGCDEGYLNITRYSDLHGLSPDEAVRKMREKVKEETGLTASAGIAPNKMLAKICSDKNKPNGQFHLPFERDAIIEFMRALSIRKLPGVGRVNERLLESIGVRTCGDIYAHRATIWLMDHYFGKTFLYKAHLGIASNVVLPYQREERKSIGAERTFSPIGSQEKILEKLEEVSIELENDMKENGWAGKTVTLKYKLDTYQVFSRAKSFNRWVMTKEDLFNTGKELIKAEFPLRLRLIGLRVTKLKDLRAPSDQGIKRFFQNAVNESPSKKRRMECTTDTHSAASQLPQYFVPESTEAVEDDVMPGFHEHDVDFEEWQDEDYETYEPSETTEERGRKGEMSESLSLNPQACTSSAKGADQVRHQNNSNGRPPDSKAKSKAEPKPVAPETEVQGGTANTRTCPICAKELDTDNLGLNAHIDFCLSKDVIKQTASSSNSSSAGTSSLIAWKKRVDAKRKGRRK